MSLITTVSAAIRGRSAGILAGLLALLVVAGGWLAGAVHRSITGPFEQGSARPAVLLVHLAPGEKDGEAALSGLEMQAPVPQPAPALTAPQLLEAVEARRIHRQVQIRRGDTLLNVLTRLGLARAEAHEAVTSLRTVFDPRRLRAGQFLSVELEGPAGSRGPLRLASLSLASDADRRVRLARSDAGGFEAASVARVLRRQPAYAAGVIEDSLYAAARRSGVPAATLARLTRLFSWDIDFQRDIQPGDRFVLLFEEITSPDGTIRRGGDILYAAFDLQGQRIAAYRFLRRDGTVDYFDREGRSIRKSLLRTPVDGARLSSGFGRRRHPILGYTRMHKGVDFAAPRGTPIYAAGSGTVTYAGRRGGYGNYVRIRHNRTYSTAYAHMLRFAKGIRKGVRVRQGQIIGYVGSTGRSTGPHLHYEVLRNGRQINPLRVKQVAVARLRGAERLAFEKTMGEIDALRQRLQSGQLVARNE